MCVRMYAHIYYVYTQSYVYTYIYTHICVYMHTHTHTHTHACYTAMPGRSSLPCARAACSCTLGCRSGSPFSGAAAGREWLDMRRLVQNYSTCFSVLARTCVSTALVQQRLKPRTPFNPQPSQPNAPDVEGAPSSHRLSASLRTSRHVVQKSGRSVHLQVCSVCGHSTNPTVPSAN